MQRQQEKLLGMKKIVTGLVICAASFATLGVTSTVAYLTKDASTTKSNGPLRTSASPIHRQLKERQQYHHRRLAFGNTNRVRDSNRDTNNNGVDVQTFNGDVDDILGDTSCAEFAGFISSSVFNDIVDSWGNNEPYIFINIEAEDNDGNDFEFKHRMDVYEGTLDDGEAWFDIRGQGIILCDEDTDAFDESDGFLITAEDDANGAEDCRVYQPRYIFTQCGSFLDSDDEGSNGCSGYGLYTCGVDISRYL